MGRFADFMFYEIDMSLKGYIAKATRKAIRFAFAKDSAHQVIKSFMGTSINAALYMDCFILINLKAS